LTYLVADLRPGLQGLGGAFFILLCDPGSPTRSVLDARHPCVFDAWQGIDEAHLCIAGRQLTNSPSAAFGPLAGPLTAHATATNRAPPGVAAKWGHTASRRRHADVVVVILPLYPFG
jgi:hypothetical protein